MRLVIADTGPLNYLVWIGAIEILPKLFDKVLVPQAVQDELKDPGAPEAVRHWASYPPPWIEVCPNPAYDDLAFDLDEGERAAIALALVVKADLILMDDREGVTAATALGFEIIGTLGLLVRAARHGLIDLDAAFTQLRATNFRFRADMMEALLAQHRKGGKP